MLTARSLLEVPRQLLELLSHHLVVVISPGVSADSAAGRLILRFGLCGVVVRAHADYGLRPGKDLPGVDTLLLPPGHIVHLAVEAGLQPRGEEVPRRRPPRRRHAE